MANTVESLLKGALVHIPRYGFTLEAIKAGTSGAVEHEKSLHALFPGPDYKPTSAPRRLFGAWDANARQESIVKTADPPKSRAEAYDAALRLLQCRLDASADVQGHLLPVRLC